MLTNDDQEIHLFAQFIASLRKEKSELFNLASDTPINFALCTHVLPDGIGDLVHLKDFADYLESIPDIHINRIAFVLEGDLEKAGSILEVDQSSNCFLIPYKIDKEGSLVVTDQGQGLLKTLQQKGILEQSDFRMQISSKLQTSDTKKFLEANGLFTVPDWLSFLEIRPGLYGYQTKAYAQGLIYMGLEKENKEAGIKLNDTIILLSEEVNSQKASKMDWVNQHIATPLVKKVVSQAISQDYFIATGYLHTKLTKQAYLMSLSQISDKKNILITSNQLNPDTLKEMDLSSLSEAGIGQIVVHNSNESESIIKIGKGQRRIDVLQMKDCTNDEINVLFAIADTTCAAGDTSIGQVMSASSLPFFDIVNNKRYFFDTQLLKFIQSFSNHQPLYDYIDACVNLVTDDGINHKMLHKMIEISTKQKPALLQQWQQVTATIRQDFNAYHGLLNFVAENATYQFFARASSWLSSNLDSKKGNIFLQKYQENFFNYLIYTERTELLIKLLENKKLDQTTVLKIFDAKNSKILRIIQEADSDRLVAAILQNLDKSEQPRFLSKIFLYCAEGDSENTWITKYASFVDCRSLDDFSFDTTMPIQEDYITALCKKALEDKDTEYFKKLSSEILYELNKILPAHLVPEEIKEILKSGVAEESFEGYTSDHYDFDLENNFEGYASDQSDIPSEEISYPPETSDKGTMSIKQRTINTLFNIPISDSNKEELFLLLDQPIEIIKQEALDWLNSSKFYENNLENQVGQVLMSFVRAIQTQNTSTPPNAYSNNISFSFFSAPTTSNQQLLEKENMLQKIEALPISPSDKEHLTQLLDDSKKNILAEIEQWRTADLYYDENVEKYIADLFTDYATQLEDEMINRNC